MDMGFDCLLISGLIISDATEGIVLYFTIGWMIGVSTATSSVVDIIFFNGGENSSVIDFFFYRLLADRCELELVQRAVVCYC